MSPTRRQTKNQARPEAGLIVSEPKKRSKARLLDLGEKPGWTRTC